jgi:dTDP-4-dehydrorhamnose reductase
MRVCVLGHRGMLGHVVARYLISQGCKVVTISERFIPSCPNSFLDEIKKNQPDWCVNCIFLPPKKAHSPQELFEINAFLPELLATQLPPSIAIIQPSTDGVFTPLLPNRLATDTPDASDDYGLSKCHAESVMKGHNHYIIRCSILGIELGTTYSLLSWFLAQKESVNGYVNHYWNGITTLQWAKVCSQIIYKNNTTNYQLFQPGILPTLTKYELLIMFSQIWDHNLDIKAILAETPVVRTLVPNIDTPSLIEQLRELKVWETSLTLR